MSHDHSSNDTYHPDAIAWDIETAPMPMSTLTQRQRRRLKKEYARLADRDPSRGVTATVRRAMSFHGFLCWICCASLAWRNEDGEIEVTSFSAERPVEERALIRNFWHITDKEQPGRRRMKWVTFNGKKFDARIMRTRSMKHEVFISNEDVLDEYPYSYNPHCDIAALWREDWPGLEDVADLFGVRYESEIKGEQVAESVARGRLDLVEDHCEADVMTTLAVYEHARATNPEVR